MAKHFFSCDRLGKVLLLKTKKASQKKAEQLLIDWQLFENDDTKKVEEIDLDHQEISADIFQKGQGTILEISNLRETWERPDLLKLRAALMKLVSGLHTTTGEYCFERCANDTCLYAETHHAWKSKRQNLEAPRRNPYPCFWAHNEQTLLFFRRTKRAVGTRLLPPFARHREGNRRTAFAGTDC